MNLAPLVYWVREREAIRQRKQAGEPWPWTDDPILRMYSFCCVRREDDRVTRWIDANIRQPYADSPHLWWMLCAARQINWPPTLQLMIDRRAWPRSTRFRPRGVTTVLEAISARGEKWHTGAYMIRAESDRSVPWFEWSKARYIAEVVLGEPWAARNRFWSLLRSPGVRMQEVHSLLTEYRGWGPFMAYQACVDMRFTRLLRDAPDRENWAAAGPGTVRGLNRLAGRPTHQHLNQDRALEEMREIWPVLQREVPTVDFSDVPNCCCEVDKYLRVKNGEGRPRVLYQPLKTRA